MNNNFENVVSQKFNNNEEIIDRFLKPILYFLDFNDENGDFTSGDEFLKTLNNFQVKDYTPDIVVTLENKVAFVVDVQGDKSESLLSDKNHLKKINMFISQREVYADFFISTNGKNTFIYGVDDTIYEPIFSFTQNELLDRKDEIYSRISRNSILKSMELFDVKSTVETIDGALFYLDDLFYTDNLALKDNVIEIIKYFKDEKHDDAIQKLEDLLKSDISELSEKIALKIILGNAYAAICKYDDAFKVYNEVLDLYDKNDFNCKGILRGKTKTYGNMGVIYIEQHENEKALESFEKALEVDQKIGCLFGQAYNLGVIARLYKDQRKIEKAIDCLEKLIEIHDEIGFKSGVASDNGNIGLLYTVLGDLETALTYHEKALEIDKEIGYSQGVAIHLGNIGFIHANDENFEEAVNYLEQAVDVLTANNLEYGKENFIKAIEYIKTEKLNKQSNKDLN